MTAVALRPLPPGLRLAHGAHPSPEAGMCLMEAVAYVAGEPHSDYPVCASPVLAAFGRALNDCLDGESRQRLVPLASRLVGTVDPVADQRDGLVCAHFLVSVWCPAWLGLVPALAAHALALRSLPPPSSWDDVVGWAPALAAAGDAARDATWAAAGDATWDATWAAAWDATWAATGDAAGDAARDATWAAAGDATWAAAWAAAGAAARAAAGDAARDAARAAARDALRPTADDLRERVIRLYESLIDQRGAR